MNQAKGYRLLARKLAGSFSQVALDAANGYDVGRVYFVKLVARGEPDRALPRRRAGLRGAEARAPRARAASASWASATRRPVSMQSSSPRSELAHTILPVLPRPQKGR